MLTHLQNRVQFYPSTRSYHNVQRAIPVLQGQAASLKIIWLTQKLHQVSKHYHNGLKDTAGVCGLLKGLDHFPQVQGQLERTRATTRVGPVVLKGSKGYTIKGPGAT